MTETYWSDANGKLKVGRVVRLSIVGFIGLLTLIGALTSVHIVDAGEVGIVTRFGDVNRVETSGLRFTVPFIEGMTEMDIRVQKEEQSVTAATEDLQDVKASLAVNYALDNETALKVYKELGVNYKGRVIVPAIQESFKAASAGFTASELITRRTEVKVKAMNDIKSRLDKYGIRLVDISITNFSFSDAFNEAIEAKQVATQQAEKAKQDLVRIQVEAEQAITKAKGEAEAQRLQQETLTPALLQKLYIEKWDGKLPTTMSGSSILSIPLK